MPAKIDRSSFLARICDALGETHVGLAKALGIPLKELYALQHLTPGEVVAPNRDEMWSLLDAHVSERIAGLFAIREEIARTLRRARKRQLEERLRVSNR